MYSYASDWNVYNITSTGVGDSVLIAYNDLRTVNAKLTELKYSKEKINKLNLIIVNDSIIKESLINNFNVVEEKNAKLTKANKILTGTSVGLLIAFIVSLIK